MYIFVEDILVLADGLARTPSEGRRVLWYGKPLSHTAPQQ